jgi:uncharacterized protein YegL
MNEQKAALTNKKATANTPQVVTLLVDDSNSMQELADGGKSKADIASASIEDMIMSAQSQNQGSRGFRFLFNISKFGDDVTPLVEARSPDDVDLETLKFFGKSGWTNMADALEWGVKATEKAIAKCRKLPVFDEPNTPPPVVLFLSDGNNTGKDVREAAERLCAISFQGGPVSVIACGVGMLDEHFPVMKAIASNEELAMNIRPSQLAEFLAAVSATLQKPDVDHFSQFRDEWDRHMGLAREALKSGRMADAEPAFLSALKAVQNAADGRTALTLSCLGTLYSVFGNWKQAQPYTISALDLIQQLGPSNAEHDAHEAAIRVAELLTIADKQPDADLLWKRVRGLINRDAANMPKPAGAWVADGFSHKAEDKPNKAKEAFEQARKVGGIGAAAALKGLAELAREHESRDMAESFQEQLLDDLVHRFGLDHDLSQKVKEELKSSYIVSGKGEKLKQLERMYR